VTGTAASRTDGLLLEVFREQRGRIWGFLLRGAGEAAAAEDLIQEAFLRAWDHREALEGADREGVRRYLWRVTRNLMVDEIRLRQRRRGREARDPIGEPVDPAPGVAEELEWGQALEVVRETVGRVKSPEGRRCLELWLEGLSPAGIAERTGLGAGRVRGLVQRARAEVVLKASNRLRAPRNR
jgi:RNA polymerase sigma-70 factor, ECF subfamily